MYDYDDEPRRRWRVVIVVLLQRRRMALRPAPALSDGDSGAPGTIVVDPETTAPTDPVSRSTLPPSAHPTSTNLPQPTVGPPIYVGRRS
jgi:hypothetical protein